MSTFYTSPTFEPMFFPTFEPILEQPQQQLMYSDQTLYESPTFTPSSTFGSSPTNVFYPYGFTFPTYPYTPQSSHSSSSSYSSSSFSGPPTASPALIFGQPDPTLFETETSYFEPHIPFPTSLPTPPTPLAETVNPFEAASPTFIASPPVTKKRSRTAQACEKCRIRKAKCSGNSPCTRCTTKKLCCVYSDDVRHRKPERPVKQPRQKSSSRPRRESEATASSLSALGLDLGTGTFDSFPGNYYFIPTCETQQW